jgi:hypothetical protein
MDQKHRASSRLHLGDLIAVTVGKAAGCAAVGWPSGHSSINTLLPSA